MASPRTIPNRIIVVGEAGNQTPAAIGTTDSAGRTASIAVFS